MGNPWKDSAQWLHSIFRDEPIQPQRKPAEKPPLPPLLRAARSLQNNANGQQRPEVLFWKQGRLLADYEDDFVYEGNCSRYYPTYAILTNEELRGYFGWRTRLRRGTLEKAPRTFAFLYLYELINQIGVANPQDGYEKLMDFRERYGALDEGILERLDQWRMDYVVYYNLDPSLLAWHPRYVWDGWVNVLAHVEDQPPEKVVSAVKTLAPSWIGRSKFYREHGGEMGEVLARVLVRMSQRYTAHHNRPLEVQFFGLPEKYYVQLFFTAVFYDRKRPRDQEYFVDPFWCFRQEGRAWSVFQYPEDGVLSSKLETLVKTVDARMRLAYDYGHPIQQDLSTKWIIRAIDEEIQAQLARKQAQEARKPTFDVFNLAKIRRDSEETRDRLVVAEELEEETPSPAPEPIAQPPAETPEQTLLSPAESRLLHDLLYGGSLDWVRQEGLLLSVLVDGINEKLYDEFLDTVLLEEGPEVLEDYVEELKGMVRP